MRLYANGTLTNTNNAGGKYKIITYVGTSNTATTSTFGCPFHQYELLTSTKPMHRVVDTTPTEHTFSVPYSHVIPF